MFGTDRPSAAWPQAAGTGATYLVVDDVDAAYTRSVESGAVGLREPTDEDYGGRGATVRDPEGNLWSFGTYRPSAG